MANLRSILWGSIRSFVVLTAVGAGFSQAARGAALPCGGDCNLNGFVEINELILGVNISLDAQSVEVCEPMDIDGTGQVAINELISAVNGALDGCPAVECVAPEGGRCVIIEPGDGAQDAALEALLDAQPKDVIFFKQGRYDFNSQLSLDDVDDVTVAGEGMNRSIISFASQTGSAEGLLVQGNRFTLQDIGLEDAPGDIFKIVGCDGLTVSAVRTEWTNGPSTDNGAYGLYPVQCRNVLIENSVVKGASDAGVYVGQSRNIIVRGNHVEDNVAGIEIENSTDADVYDNLATGNTGGVLVFNLPGPPVQDGRRTRIFDNRIIANNEPNFGAPGSSVSGVPKGTGVIVLANDDVEIFENQFTDNDSTHITLISYNTAVLFGQEPPNNPDFDPYSETVFIHDNVFTGGGTDPDPGLSDVVTLNGGLPLPAILFDGDADPEKMEDDALPDRLRTCVQQPGATFINLDIGNSFEGLTKDLASVDCTHDQLGAAVVGALRRIDIAPGPNAQEELLTALIDAQPGDDIVLAAGTYDIDMALSLSADHVTLRGAGMGQTILNLAGVTSSGEGLLVQANDFTVEDLAFENAPGDQLKVLGADGLRIRRVRAEWTNGPDSENGAYGLYPVQCKDVLIEDCVVKGASDAGVYVGQSRNVIVRRNEVQFNVAGIEIENTTAADVYENLATNNTGGILVFNLPGLPVYGERTRVFNNESVENNTPNFAPAGNIVAGVPKGTGLMILANDRVEITDNTFRDNDTSQITLISYNTATLLGGNEPPNDPLFDAFSEGILVRGNTYDGGGTDPDEMVADLTLLLGLPIPQIVFDGDIDADKFVEGSLPAALRTCVQEETPPTFVNLDIANSFMNFSRDLAPFNCSHSLLTPVAMAGVQ